MTLPAHIEKHISPEPNTGCWLWMASLDKDGYPLMSKTRERPTTRAHRLVYELLVAPIPIGLTLDHQCLLKCCVNPEHLKPATHKENILRSSGRGAMNARKLVCDNGHPFDHVGSRGERRCRQCYNAYSRMWKAKNK